MKNIILFLCFSIRLAAQTGFENDHLNADSLQIWVNQILELHQIPPKIPIEAFAHVNTVSSVIRDNVPYLLYNARFMDSTQTLKEGKWRIIGMFAHEIGHHLLFHTLSKSGTSPKLELEADQWAGCQLYLLGATLEQAVLCVESASLNGTLTHPARHLRVQAIQKGWKEMKVRMESLPLRSVPSDFTEFKTGVSFQMKYIAENSFPMGGMDREARPEEKPVHTVYLSAFYMGKYEVTISEFREFIHATGYRTDAEKENSSFIWTGNQFEQTRGVNWRQDEFGRDRIGANYPVIHISWNDAVAYCEWLSRITGKKYRLPTEAEWEYAARGGSTELYAGSNNLDEIAWFGSNSGFKLHSVGEKGSNPHGLYDMSGNVWEWCNDWNSTYSSNAVRNPTGEAVGNFRILRGGSWNGDASYCRVARRNRNAPSTRNSYYGFRVVCVP